MIDLLHHVGIVVRDADEALGFYRDVMGLTVAKDEVVEEQGVRGVLLPVGENEIELLQPVRDGTGVARFLESRGPTLHHICLRTDDIRAELARIRALGVELIDEEPRYGLAGEIAFLHPRSMHGVLVELAEVEDRHASPEKGFDHIACRVSDYEAARQRWGEVAGLEEHAQLRNEETGMLIGQFPIGQCMLELLAPDGPDSALGEQPEGASPMVAIAVRTSMRRLPATARPGWTCRTRRWACCRGRGAPGSARRRRSGSASSCWSTSAELVGRLSASARAW